MSRTLTFLALTAVVSFATAPAFAATTLAGGPSTREGGAAHSMNHHMMMRGHHSMKMKSVHKSGSTDQVTGTTPAGGQKDGAK